MTIMVSYCIILDIDYLGQHICIMNLLLDCLTDNEYHRN